MKRWSGLALFCLGILIFSTTMVSAVSYSDADNDGICEPGEKITFYADPNFDYYDWDFDNDGLPDDNGEVVTHIFTEEGVYTVSVVETNGHTEQKSIEIVVASENEPSSEPEFDNYMKIMNKIEKILTRLDRNNVKIELMVKLVMKECKKLVQHGVSEEDIEYIINYMDQQIKNH